MKIKTTIIILMLCASGFAQKKVTQKTHSQAYTHLKSYKNLFGDNFSKADSLSFIIKDNDTLVPLPKDYIKLSGVSVPYEAKDSAFLEIYKDLVFKKHQEPKNISKNKLKMRYWKKPLKIYFTKNVDKTVKQELKKFAKQLSSEIDSLNITFVGKIENSNYIIYGHNSENDSIYDTHIKKSANDYYISWDGNQRIYDCKLQINSNSYKNKEDLISVSKNLFLGSLGHFNKTNLLPKESMLSSLYSKNKTFTNIDLEILKYHYSYGICKGTDLNTFEEQHSKAKNLFLETGRILNFRHPK
jgi:hypothetical protein